MNEVNMSRAFLLAQNYVFLIKNHIHVLICKRLVASTCERHILFMEPDMKLYVSTARFLPECECCFAFFFHFITFFFSQVLLPYQLVAECDSYHALSPAQDTLVYQPPACQHNFVAIPSLSRITSLGNECNSACIQSSLQSSACVCVCVSVLVCCGLITLDYWE